MGRKSKNNQVLDALQAFQMSYGITKGVRDEMGSADAYKEATAVTEGQSGGVRTETGAPSQAEMSTAGANGEMSNGYQANPEYTGAAGEDKYVYVGDATADGKARGLQAQYSAPVGGATTYTMGGKTQAESFTPDQQMAAGLQGQQKYYASVGNTDKATELGLKARQMRSYDNQDQLTAAQIKMLPMQEESTKIDLEQKKLKAAIEKNEDEMWKASRSADSLVSHYNESFKDGYTAKLITNKDGTTAIAKLNDKGELAETLMSFKDWDSDGRKQVLQHLPTFAKEQYKLDLQHKNKMAEIEATKQGNVAYAHAIAGGRAGAAETKITPEQQKTMSELNQQYYATEDPAVQRGIARKLNMVTNEILVANKRAPDFRGLTSVDKNAASSATPTPEEYEARAWDHGLKNGTDPKEIARNVAGYAATHAERQTKWGKGGMADVPPKPKVGAPAQPAAAGPLGPRLRDTLQLDAPAAPRGQQRQGPTTEQLYTAKIQQAIKTNPDIAQIDAQLVGLGKKFGPLAYAPPNVKQQALALQQSRMQVLSAIEQDFQQ